MIWFQEKNGLLNSNHYDHFICISSLIYILTFLGESHGAVSVFTLTDGIVISQEVINHNDPPVENIEVLQVISDKDDADQRNGFVWTFVYPGCFIYQWQTKGQRKIRNRLVKEDKQLESAMSSQGFS